MIILPSPNWWQHPLHEENRKPFFGDESELAKLLRTGIEDANTVLQELDALREQEDRFPLAYKRYPNDYAARVMAGWRAVYRALDLVSQRRGEIERDAGLPDDQRSAAWGELRQHLYGAIEDFDAVFGDPSASVQRVEAESLVWSVTGGDFWRTIFHQIGQSRANAGLWIVGNLLGDLTANSGQNTRPRSATTPIVAVSQELGQGYVLWLTVELLPGQPDGFDPDPKALGLMAIRKRKENDEEIDFIDSMRAVWRKAGINSRSAGATYRGRWRITSRCPSGDERFQDQPSAFLPRLEGRSAEAAALAAIWAAAGWVPYETPYESDQPFRLLGDAAISAALGDPVPGEPRTEMRLQKVGSLDKKIRAAQRWDMLLLVGIDEDDDSSEDKRRRTGREQAGQALTTHTGVRLSRQTTIGLALHHMLQTSQWLHMWHQHQNEKWLARWEPGTADLAAMEVKTEEPDAGRNS